MEVLEWVERLGGWAVVVIVVRWMMSKQDRLIRGLEEAVKTFKSFEHEEREAHTQIIHHLKEMTQEK